METAIVGYTGIIEYRLGFYRDNGKENGNCKNGLYSDCRIYIVVL